MLLAPWQPGLAAQAGAAEQRAPGAKPAAAAACLPDACRHGDMCGSYTHPAPAAGASLIPCSTSGSASGKILWKTLSCCANVCYSWQFVALTQGGVAPVLPKRPHRARACLPPCALQASSAVGCHLMPAHTRPAGLRRAALLNALLSPFLLMFLLLYFFMRNAERFYHHPGARRGLPASCCAWAAGKQLDRLRPLAKAYAAHTPACLVGHHGGPGWGVARGARLPPPPPPPPPGPPGAAPCRQRRQQALEWAGTLAPSGAERAAPLRHSPVSTCGAVFCSHWNCPGPASQWVSAQQQLVNQALLGLPSPYCPPDSTRHQCARVGEQRGCEGLHAACTPVQPCGCTRLCLTGRLLLGDP
jgi:hypothetical protein